MTYNKPEVIVRSRAVDVIQSGQVKTDVFKDSVDVNHPMNATSTAYEADE